MSLCLLFAVMVVAGGASRGDVAGQLVVRAVCWGLLIVVIVVGDRPTLNTARPVALLLLAATVLTVLQLIPLPPALWSALPGRDILLQAATLSGQPQPWRPWSIVPDATFNALQSLVVPATTLLLLCSIRPAERAWLPGLLLCVVLISAIFGVLQLTGAGLGNPLINDTPGVISGSFANRNHYALFLALGCLLIPGWVFANGRRASWRVPTGLGLLLLFSLMILATGSRAGIGIGILAIVAAVVLAWQDIGRNLRRTRPWVRPALITGIVTLVLAFVAISVAADRATSISRIFAVDPGQDMRGKALPTVLSMISEYFPVGSGLGGFDPIFRMHEPFGLLKLTYFNHAHNDFLEVALDAGLPGLVLMIAALGWWGWASARAWRRQAAPSLLSRSGSASVLLLILGSIIDYPLRTPMMMAVLMVAAVWLTGHSSDTHPSALPNGR
ncbi:O-antigen ligase family protein [Sphingomonas sp. XXL09]|uniref:O-antigen ligase family protein n=1 Tax=Sphingomonas sp. XXL09 TaxID=3457787 RepID=UPI00406BB8F2